MFDKKKKKASTDNVSNDEPVRQNALRELPQTTRRNAWKLWSYTSDNETYGATVNGGTLIRSVTTVNGSIAESMVYIPGYTRAVNSDGETMDLA